MSHPHAVTGIKEILSKLKDEDLNGLVMTVTHGLLKNRISSKEDAITTILKYSPDELSILKRRALTRDLLFSYLYDNNISVVLPVTKDKLVDKICLMWDLSVENQNSNTVTDEKISLDDILTKPPDKSVENDINVMAQKFAEWFYILLNQNESPGCEHFFQDAKLILNITTNGECMTNEVEQPESITQLLFNTKVEYNLYFNPNLNKDGVRGCMDAHGLVLILTCGTLHTNSECVGIFEQVFALARDPFCDNNWKIKNTKLNLHSKRIEKAPSLTQNDLNFIMLSS